MTKQIPTNEPFLSVFLDQHSRILVGPTSIPKEAPFFNRRMTNDKNLEESN